MIDIGILNSELTLSGALLATSWGAVRLATRLTAQHCARTEVRFWYLTFRNIALLMCSVGLAVIWKAQLQSVLLALGAAVAGVFVAFREAWLSLLGFWLRFVTRSYSVGEYIEIDGHRGQVVDISCQYTVLAETGDGKDMLLSSGRMIRVPNNRLLMTPMIHENMTGTYSAFMVAIPLSSKADPLKAQATLQAIAERACAPFSEDAQAHMHNVQSTSYMATPSVAPKVVFKFGEKGRLYLHLRVVAPAQEKLKVEQLILSEFFSCGDPSVWPDNRELDS